MRHDLSRDAARAVARILYSGAVTINGKPATIGGWDDEFASVRTLDMAGPRGKWSWHAVAHVLRSGGKFTL